PVIRGLGGHRVLILEDGLSTGDTSAQSDDHGVSVDPLLVDQIEILRGPATLLYGSRAVGGVVNLIDGRIPREQAAEPLSGRFEVRGDSVADERSGVLRLDGGSGELAWHLDGSWRDADDYRIPGAARVEDEHGHEEHTGEEPGHAEEEHPDEVTGRLFNSFVETRSGTAGLSWVTDRGHLGTSIREYRSDYGIPAPHAHFEEEHGHEEEPGHDEETAHEEEEEYAWIDMEQRTWDVSGALDDPMRGITSADLRLRHTDYTHQEIEMEGHEDHADEEEPGAEAHDHGGTVFDVRNWLARLELETVPVLGGWEGALGLQLREQDYSATGEEAFVPDNESRSWGVFALQERNFGDLTLNAGVRVERTRVRLGAQGEEHGHEDEHGHEEEHSDIASRRFTTWSASAGAIRQLNEQWQVALNGQHSQRAPSETELFADGPHLATFTFEEGNPALDKERTNALDLKFHRHSDRFDFEANLFYNRIRDFIYLAETDEEIGGFRVREAIQEDAIFHGFELQGVWQVFTSDMGHFDIRINYDQVRGRLEQGGNLPRISPERIGGMLDWHHGSWRASLDVQRMMRQDHTARFEEETAGYNMVNARFAYQLTPGTADLEVFVQGRNLGDQEARTATSFLKDFAPLPGRSLAIGIRGRF
ncbi:MAG: TonB-dependent receptor, partial [Pseudomonadota bacterium]